MPEIVIVIPDGTEFAVASECLANSEYLQEIWKQEQAENPEVTAIKVGGAVPRPYLEFALNYLQATCGTEYQFLELLGQPLEEALDNEELFALTDPANVQQLTKLSQYVFGFLGIVSFQSFYQLMLLEAIQVGPVTRSMAEDVAESILPFLSDEQLYLVAEYNSKLIDRVLDLPNAQRYLKVRISRWRIALYDGIQFEIKSRGRLYIRGRPANTAGPVSKIFAHRTDKSSGYYYYIDQQGQIFEGVINSNVVEGTFQLELPEPVIDCSTNGKTTLILTNTGKVYGYGDNTHQQLGGGAGIVSEPQLLVLDFRCKQVLVVEDRSILLTQDGQVYSMIDGVVRKFEYIPAGVRQVLEPGTGDIQVLTADLHVIRYHNGVGQELADGIYFMAPNGLFITSELNVLDPNGIVIERKILAITTSEDHELYLTTTDTTRVVKYRVQDGVIRREKVLKATR